MVTVPVVAGIDFARGTSDNRLNSRKEFNPGMLGES